MTKPGKLGLQDEAFLLIEKPESPTHVAGLQIFELPRGYRGHFIRDLFETYGDNARSVSPPFNLKLADPKAKRGHRWIEDDHFDIDYHVRFTALPAPGSHTQLMRLVERLHARPLDRHYPLWEYYFIEGLEGRRFAVYVKVHHSMVDGMAAMALLQATLCTDPKEQRTTPIWSIKGLTGGDDSARRAKLFAQIGKAYANLWGQTRSVPEIYMSLVKSGLGKAVGRGKNNPLPFQAPHTILNQDIQAQRRFAARTLSLKRLKKIGAAHGATVNDVVLAICSGALRSYLSRQRQLPRETMTAICPVAVRSEKTAGKGNSLSVIIAGLGTNKRDPVARLDAVMGSMAAAKTDLGAMSETAMTNYALLINGALLVAQPLRVTKRINPISNLVISNVPGPREPLYLNGAKLVANYPLSVLVHGLALNITVTSYLDSMDFGLMGTRDILPDIDVLAD
ncbi:MAG: wax ester/triacylglycerol synthase family O-acyltransferase, partial [Pseudomonadota bacterium]